MRMSESEPMNDKFSIKNLLFYRAIPNYEIPIPTDGHKVFACTDCCDRFLLESSYERHINRKSLKITYMCRHCNNTKVFLNRCNLLSHIRSHAFKTATINVSDLKVEPLPLSYLKANASSNNEEVQVISPHSSKETSAKGVCFDCKSEFFSPGPIFKERAKHYMRLSDEVFTCPICLFAMPNECGLKAHLRLHTNHPPFYCPECGQHLSTRTIKYPYTHHCEGFKMMRATARMQCPVSNCNLLHPNDVNGHLNKDHVVKVFKCNACVVASYSNQTMIKHLKTHNVECKALVFYQCVLCPGRLVLPGQIDHHLRSHTMEINNFVYVYPCWNCGLTCNDIYSFLNHHIEKHCNTETIRKIFESAASLFGNSASKRIYRVVKRCDRCLRSFTYKCKYDEIQVLPDECPYRCTMEKQTGDLSTKIPSPVLVEKNIKCPCCTMTISEKWENIKQHFSESHKNQRCIDVKISLQRIKMKQNETKLKKKRNRQLKKNIGLKQNRKNNTKDIPVTASTSKINKYGCNMCDYVGEDKESFETHIINHRDPCMAYQCMECAKCFVVKPSFSTHLLLEHNISDIDEYIAQKQCYNETALDKYQNNFEESTEPLRENQCRICRDQFDNSDDLEKHFRVHGMAFILKKTSNKSP